MKFSTIAGALVLTTSVLARAEDVEAQWFPAPSHSEEEISTLISTLKEASTSKKESTSSSSIEESSISTKKVSSTKEPASTTATLPKTPSISTKAPETTTKTKKASTSKEPKSKHVSPSSKITKTIHIISTKPVSKITKTVTKSKAVKQVKATTTANITTPKITTHFVDNANTAGISGLIAVAAGIALLL
jgi:hypothetical protein